MADHLYFDINHLRRGDFFNLNAELRTDEGHSYEIEKWIGRGGNAAVYQCHEQETDEECAIKFLMNVNSRNEKRFGREIKLFKSVTGTHITRFYGSGHTTARHNKTEKDHTLLFFVMELADYNLQKVMHKKAGLLDYGQYAGQFRGLASALASLHDYPAVHRDIKPENILVAGERWLLSDYGLCTFVNPGEEDLTPPGKRNIGPKFWLSPEAHNRRLGCEDQICPASDVFQLASIFWYVATGRHPSGIVTEDDWTGPKKLFPVLYQSLFHKPEKRPQNGGEFLTQLENALSQ